MAKPPSDLRQTSWVPVANMTHMADGPAADKTQAWDGAETAAGETVHVPHAIPDAASAEQTGYAWTENDDYSAQDEKDDDSSEPATVRQSWRATLRIAGGLIVVGLVIAGAIIFGRWLFITPTKTEQQTAGPGTSAEGASATSSAAGLTGGPTSITSTADQDKKYIEDLNQQGITFDNPDNAVTNGKMVCDDLRRGVTVPQIISEFKASITNLADKADKYVAISVRSYCSQYDDLVKGY